MQLLDLTAAARREVNDDVAPRARSAVSGGNGNLSKRATIRFIVLDLSTTRAGSFIPPALVRGSLAACRGQVFAYRLLCPTVKMPASHHCHQSGDHPCSSRALPSLFSLLVPTQPSTHSILRCDLNTNQQRGCVSVRITRQMAQPLAAVEPKPSTSYDCEQPQQLASDIARSIFRVTIDRVS